MKDEMMEEITNKINAIERRRETVLQNFFDILFWKDQSGAYVDLNDKCAIIDLMDTAKVKGPEGETWVEGDREKIFELANRIRTKIGLPLLKIERWGFIEEVKHENR